MRTDKELLDAVDALSHMGVGLISDDNGHWAMTGDGMQSVPMEEGPMDVSTSFWVEKKDWHNSIREAINAYLDADEDDKP